MLIAEMAHVLIAYLIILWWECWKICFGIL